jgi:hypothetical protein
MRVQFSILRLMIVVLAAALVLAAWRLAGRISANLVLNLTVVALIAATYKARSAQGRKGVWWLGFATLGWVHLFFWLCGVPWGQGYAFRVDFISSLVFWVLAANVGLEQLATDMTRDPEPAVARTLILQCATTIIVSLIGAWSFSFAAWLGDRRPKTGTSNQTRSS